MSQTVNCNDTELSTYLQALEAGYLPTCSSDIAQSVPLKLIHIANKSYRHGKKTVCFPGFQFMMTLEHSTENLGEGSPTSSAEGSPVRIYQPPEKGRGSTEKDRDCGEKWRASFAKFDQNTHLWKIPQLSLFEDLILSSLTWPRWGTMRNGECWEQTMPDVFIREKEYGLSLPTPIATEYKGAGRKRFGGSEKYRGGKMSEALRTCESDPIYLNPSFAELTMMFPMGWTDLRPLETDKFREWQRLHGKSYLTGVVNHDH